MPPEKHPAPHARPAGLPDTDPAVAAELARLSDEYVRRIREEGDRDPLGAKAALKAMFDAMPEPKPLTKEEEEALGRIDRCLGVPLPPGSSRYVGGRMGRYR